MKDKYKTKKELIKELQGLRQQISNLEIVETKRKLVEDALRDVSLQREEMERIVNRSPAVVFLWRNAPGWPVEYVSDNVRQFGYSPDDFYSGKLPYSDFIHSSDLERVASEVTHNSSQPGKDKFIQKYRVLTNTGDIRWVDDWTWIRRNENGEITHYQGIILDVTERKRAEEELRQSEERFRTLVEKSVEAIFLINFDGEIVFWNPAAERLIGLSDKPTRKMTLSDVLTPDSLKIARANIAHTVQTGTTQPSPYELTVRKFDGTLALIELFIGLIDYEGEKHLLGTARDVTERKRMEEALHRRETILGAVSSAAEQFLRATSLEQGNIQEVLAQLGKATNVNRVYVFENHIGEDGTHLTSQCYEWVGPGIMSQMDDPDLHNFSWQAGGMGRWEKMLSQGQIIQGHVREFPASEKRILAPQDIQSIVAVPIFVSEKWWGFMGFDECQKEHEWSKPEIDALKTAGAILGALIERSQVEELLRESEEKYSSVVENSMDGIIVLQKGIIKFFNQAILDITGYNLEELIDKEFETLISPEYRKLVMDRYQARLAGKDVPSMYEMEIIRKDGILAPIEISNSTITYEGKKAILTFIRDITERKKAEEALKRSEEKCRDLIENASDAIFTIDRLGRFINGNKKGEEISGYEREELLGKSFKRLVPVKYMPSIMKIVGKAFRGKIEHGQIEIEIKNKKGRLIPLEITGRTIWGDGKVIAIQCVARDIIERKKAEEIQKLQNRIANAVLATDDLEQLFKLIHKELGKVMDTSNFFIALYDKENGKISLPYFVDKKDKSGTFPAGKTLTAYIIKNNRPLLMSRGKIDEMIKSGEVRTIGMPSKVWLGVPLQVGQEVIGAIVVQSYEDENALGEEELEILKFVSSQIGLSVERKRGEEALRKSEGEYRDLMEEAPIGLCNIDIKGKVLFVNKRFEEVSGYTREEVVGKNGFKLGMFGEDTINLFAKRIKDRLMGKTPRILEFQFKCKDGRWLWVELDAKLIKKFGVPIGFQLATRDITERRVTREALRESEEKFRAISVSAQHAIIVADNEGNVTYWNKAAENMFGYTSQEILSKELHGFIMPQRFQEAFRHGFDKFKDTGRGDLIGKPFETVGMKRDGTEFPVELSISSVKMGGKWNAIAIMRDLTERRKMEREIEERKTYLEKMLISEPDAVVTHDAEGRVVEWNPGAEKLFGYKPKEVVGKVLDDLIAGPDPEKYREATSIAKRFLAGESIDSFETIRYRKDGSPVDVILSGSGIFIKNKLIGVVATYKDITERKKVEEELRKSREQLRSLSAHLQAVREGERTSIAREIHDDLGQTMTALKMDFSLLNRLIPKEEKVLLRKTESMSKLVDMILQDTKRISTELRPGLLDDLGLFAAIEWQAEEFQNRTQIECEVTLEPEDIVLDRDCSTAIFRIFQETLTNIARHANATKVSINLTEKGGKLTLKVGDNGRGITEEQIYDSKSFGLIGIRERVAFLGGKVKIKGVRNKGTTITVSIPFGGAG